MVPSLTSVVVLRLVLPKGSLERATFELFEAADLSVNRSSAVDYKATIDDPRVDEVRILRPQEIPTYVAEGLFDVGITGRDWVEETGAVVASLGELRYSKATSKPVKVVVAVAGDSPVQRVEDLHDGVRVTSEYGRALRAAGLRVIDTILTSYTEVVANPASFADPAKKHAMDQLMTLLNGALEARGKVLLKLNVVADRKQAVIDVLPSAKSPTVNQLANGDYAIETVVEKNGINRLIPELIEQGATDLLEIPISKIIH